MMNRRTAGIAVLALVIAAVILGVLLSNPQDHKQLGSAEAYCSKEPGLPNLTGPEFKNCVEHYLSVR
jgi:hypothetical protein